MQYLISEDLIKYIENNIDLLDESPTELIKNAYNQRYLYVWEVGQLIRMLHDSNIDFDSSILPKLLSYSNYDFSYKSNDEIINDFYADTLSLTKDLIIKGIDEISPDVLHYSIVNDKFLSKGYIQTKNWKAAQAPYVVTIGAVCKESDIRLFTCLSINSADLNSSIEIYYPKIMGKILDDVGYMYDKLTYDRQVVSFEDQITRLVEEVLRQVYGYDV